MPIGRSICYSNCYVCRRHRGRMREAHPREDRRCGGAQDRRRRATPSQDALRQDPARHHAQDRRQGGVQDAGDDR